MSEHGKSSVPANVGKWVLRALYVACALSVAADFTYDKHGHYDVEHWPGFHAGYGFISFVGLVLTAIVLRKLVSRPEDYYEPEPADEGDAHDGGHHG